VEYYKKFFTSDKPNTVPDKFSFGETSHMMT